ncbi:MAG: CCA tRNA nucleotidyltransferase [Verrucomicrobia bacterium]|nr:CCA tRNA nucleotidyltransferase [Leptolyngbya sp. ES-bin-22]
MDLKYQLSVPAVSSALSPKTWPFSLEWLPHSAYLVGGTVRDALLERESEYLDLDFVMPVGAVETAQAIARHYKAGFVLLDADRQIARVVFEQGTADFAQQVGATLEADLERRDFTVNAIAYNPHTDQLLDPLHGYADLQKHQLRMIAPENLREDPLRLLRAYRQAAQLGFTVEAETRSVIRKLAALLQRIAAERVQSELNYLLSATSGTTWLTMAWQDALLDDWFPAATAQSLALVAAIDQTAGTLQETMPDFAWALFSRIRNVPKQRHKPCKSPDGERSSLQKPELTVSGSTRTWLTTAKLASLLPSNVAQAELQLRRLKYSRTEVQAVSTILKCLPQLCPSATADAVIASASDSTWNLQPLTPLDLSLRQQYEFFQSAGATFPAIALLAIALGMPVEAIAPLMQRFLTPGDPVAHASPLLTGQDLMTALQLPAGPRIGRLLSAIQLARAEAKITTPAEALHWAATLVEGEE